MCFELFNFNSRISEFRAKTKPLLIPDSHQNRFSQSRKSEFRVFSIVHLHIYTLTEPENKMVPLLPWEPWPSEFEVQKNDSLALIIEIL